MKKISPPSPPQLVIIGHVAYDQTDFRDGTPSHHFPSGAAYFGATGASLFNKNIGIVSRVGSDYDLGLITRLRVDTEGIRQISDGKTTRFYFIYDTPSSKERTFRSEFNVNEDLSPSDIPLRYIQARHIHIASMPPHKQQLFVDFLKKNSAATISLDTIEQHAEQWPELITNVIKNVDMVFLNHQERVFLEKYGLSAVLSKKQFILKERDKGATYTDKNEQFTVKAPHIETIVDKSGTGDVLAGVFLACIARGDTKQNALRNAVTTASESLRGCGVETLIKP